MNAQIQKISKNGILLIRPTHEEALIEKFLGTFKAKLAPKLNHIFFTKLYMVEGL